jgi:hypothetical protein
MTRLLAGMNSIYADFGEGVPSPAGMLDNMGTSCYYSVYENRKKHKET